MYEANAFPSDYHAFMSQAKLHGLDPADVLVPLSPRDGEDTLRTEDVLKAIEDAGSALAVLCLGTVQYCTGQLFDVRAITAAAQGVGAYAVWDCAHAAGNIDLKLHDWGVDGACWCTYKYLNSGPGGIGGFFIHEKHHGSNLPHLAGWWGHKRDTRFKMEHAFDAIGGAASYQLSNPPVLQVVSLLASLQVFAKTSMTELRGRSMLLTAYLELIIRGIAKSSDLAVETITPTDHMRRGCQLSLKFGTEEIAKMVHARLEKRGAILDFRSPNVLRAAPAPLYNTFADIARLGAVLSSSLKEQ